MAAAGKKKAEKKKAAKNKTKKKASNGATVGFEAELFLAADKLRKNLEPSDYKHIVLGLIFLKYISDSFEAKRAALLAEDADAAEDPDEYLADRVFWVPKQARWSELQANAKDPSIGKRIDDAMLAIEAKNVSLKGVLPKEYAKPNLDKIMLGELIDLISGIAMHEEIGEARDVLGRVYEYFLSEFAGAEGKRGGEFYTPRSVVRLLVEMLEPYKGRVLDPCCGSGGMFVQSERFVEEHGGRIGDIAIYGQESNYTTWRLAMMNLAVRGIDADVRWNNEGSFHNDALPDLKADYVIANPPFNDSDWGGERLSEDVRWKYGVPPASNANFAWVQHFVHHLKPSGTAGFVLAIMSLASEDESEKKIRREIVEQDLVDCIVTLPGRLFYSTPIPVCLWFLTRSKESAGHRPRKGETLFIDASALGRAETRTHSVLTEEDILRVATSYHSWRHEGGEYEDVAGLCRAVDLERIRANDYSLFPASYIEAGGVDVASASSPADAASDFFDALRAHYSESRRLRAHIQSQIGELLSRDGALYSGTVGEWSLADVLTLSDETLGDRDEPEILTCTENAGLILQRERFSKRVATEDTSKYKAVYFTDIVYNPYLLWAGAIDQCTIVDFGVTSPAYPVFRVREGFDPFIVGRALKSAVMMQKYNGISVGTVQRRRRAPPEKFLGLQIKLPPLDEQARVRPIAAMLHMEIKAARDFGALTSTMFETLAKLLTIEPRNND